MKTITTPRVIREGTQAPTAAHYYIETDRTYTAERNARVFAMVDHEGVGTVALDVSFRRRPGEIARPTEPNTATVLIDSFVVAPGQEADLFSLACDVLQAWANDNASLERCAAFLAEQVPGLAKEKTR